MDNILKYQNPSSPLLIQRVNQSGANFVKRLLDPDRKSIPDWETKGQKIATHKMSWGEDDHGAYVFPEVQEIDGQLIDFSRPPYAPGIADYMAHKNNNIVRMSPEEADWFTRNYKQYYPSFKKGGGIHIKKKNRGSFTRWCKGKVTEECIRKGKNSPNPAIRKKATFAANARRWKHENGGILRAQEGTRNGFWSKLWNAVKAGGMTARDARLGAVGAKQVRDLYSEGKNQEAQDLAKSYAKANTAGIALAGGAASTGLLGDLMVTGATTVANTFIDGDTKNFGKNLLFNAAFDLAGHGSGQLLRNIDWGKVRNAGKSFSKSRIDPVFINGEINQAGIQEGLFGGKRSAESFMGSQTYKDAVAHDIALAKRAFGYDISPVMDDRYIKMPVKVEGASLGPHDAGIMYPNPNTNNPADDRILVDVGKHKTVNDLAATIFHENLHHGRFKTIDPQGNTLFTEIYHPEKVNPTLDFYRWKLKHLFKPEVEIPQELLDHYKYLTSVEIPHNEGATNVLELGFLGNARAKSGYPGAQEVQRILDEVRKANPQHSYTIDLLNMKKPKRVWEAMTGQYEDGGKLTDDDYRERVKKFLLWKTVSPEESTYIKNFKM